ncbi:MAG TPA: autotransporter outer membrane beta-barrel domain-containing protein, partial [Devosia sp.]|nr:autotransporter outer membrane beta-barrel domain-containing protein [Devosia sp.]
FSDQIGSATGATFSIIGAGTIFTSGSNMFVGSAGNPGSGFVGDGALLNTVQASIGQSGMGDFVVTGAGTQWITKGRGATGSNSSYVVVGGNSTGDGTLTVTDGARVDVESFLTVAGTGKGRATVSNNASLTTHYELRVGMSSGGVGLLSVESGGRVNGNAAFIGNGGTGVVNVSGAPSRLAIASDLFLGGGNAGAGQRDGTLNVIDGGLATAELAYIGHTGTGVVNVTGPGSQFVVADSAYIANQAGSIGTLRTTGGGQARVRTLHAGNQGTGVVVINGANSELQVTDTLYIGTYAGSTGTAEVSAGGTLTTNRAVIAESGTASATVTGAGSTWTVAEDLILGTSGGVGDLHILSGGQVAADTVTFGAGSGSGGGAIWIHDSVLAAGQIRSDDANVAGLNLNNGTLLLTRDQGALFEGMAAGQIDFGAGGGVINTQGFDVQTAAALSGIGRMIKQGSGTLTLGEQAAHTGGTLVAQGTLAAARADVFASAGLHDIAASGTLMLNGFDQTVSAISNAGTIRFGGASAGTVLTINNDYAGAGGTIDFNVELGDDTSPTDLLVVNGNTSGNSLLRVTNVGGRGSETAGDGIRIVQVDGTSAADAFTLSGPAIAGAYSYDLFHNGVADPVDGDWYLRSAGLAPT